MSNRFILNHLQPAARDDVGGYLRARALFDRRGMQQLAPLGLYIRAAKHRRICPGEAYALGYVGLPRLGLLLLLTPRERIFGECRYSPGSVVVSCAAPEVPPVCAEIKSSENASSLSRDTQSLKSLNIFSAPL